VWGAAFLFFRVAAPVVGPIWTAEIRIALASLALAVVVGPAAFRSIRGRVLQVAFVGATFSAIPFALLSFAALSLPASLESLLMATTPLFTAMVSSAWIGQRMTRPMVVGLAIGFGAVAVLLGGAPVALTPQTVAAFGAGLGAAFSYAVAGTFVRRTVADIPPLHLATGQLVLGALVLLPVAVLSGAPGTPTPVAIEALVTMAILSTAIAWPIFFRISRQTNPTAASTVTFIVPMFGALWGGLFLGESIGAGLLAGFALVFVSLVLVLRLPLTFGRIPLPVRILAIRAPASARP
jgi:drug/metabolite transporter (DMT)-like permease